MPSTAPPPAPSAVRRDDQGFLLDPDAWTEDLARAIAAEEGIALTDDHWAVIAFMRDHRRRTNTAPDARLVIRFLKEERDLKDRNTLFRLFPYGYVQQACKIAGMTLPRAWSTG